jgi:ArsR family transcriptional regulator, arsenate/arsenite/antimonite-responsive transcriptional repressor
MSIKKSDNTTIKIAKVIKALGHPIRIDILRLLSAKQNEKLSVKEIHKCLGLSQPETSKHLIVLKNQSVLVCEKREGHSFYKINKEYSFIQNIINYLKRN